AGGLLFAHDAAVAHVADGLAIRDDEHGAAAEAQLDELLEAFLRPHALAREAQPRLLLGSAPRASQRAREPRDLAGQRTEQARVGIGGWRHGAARLHLLRPPRDARLPTPHRPPPERQSHADDG